MEKRNGELVVIDTETTGLEEPELIQVAYIDVFRARCSDPIKAFGHRSRLNTAHLGNSSYSAE